MTGEEPRKKTTREDLLFTEEVYQAMGAAMDVNRILGPGFLEPVYQEALAIELERHRVPFAAQVPLKIAYREGFLDKKYVADFIVHGQIIVEIKALDRLSGKEEAQLLNYLKATGLRVGILLNFGNPSGLEWKRFVL